MGEGGDGLGVVGDGLLDRLLRRARARAGLARVALLQPELVAHVVGPIDDGAVAVEAEAHRLGVVARLAQAQPEAVAVLLDAHQLDRHDHAFLQHLARVLDAPVRHLGDVDEPLDGPVEAHERAEGHQLRDPPDQHLADDEAVHGAVPLLGMRALQRERDLARLAVHAEDVGLHLVADLEEVLRLLAALPGELGQVGEAVRPAEVDEDAEVGDGGDAALADLALLQLLDDAFLLLAPPFRHGRALGEDGAVLAAVDLDHLEAHFLAHEGGERLRRVRVVAPDAVDLGEGDEGVDALDVGEHAAAVVADDLGGEDFAGFEARGQHLPAFLAAGAVEGDDAVALRAHRLQDHHADAVARLQAALAVRAQREHLALGDDRLGLGADVDDDAVGRGAHDDALDDLAAAEAAGLSGLRFEQGGHVHLGARLGRRRGGLGGRGRFGGRHGRGLRRGRSRFGGGDGGRGGALGDGGGGSGGIGDDRRGGRFAGDGRRGLFVGGHWWAPFDRVARLDVRRDGRPLFWPRL